MATVIAAVSDVHAGSSVAVCPPGPIPQGDGPSLSPSKVQVWLYRLWERYWARVKETRDALDADLYCILNGDLLEGDHHNTPQLMSRHPGVEKWIARELLRDALDLDPDHWFVVRGTETHVGKAGAAEEAMAEWLGAEQDPSTGTWSWWFLRLDVDGVRIDVAHHGRMGRRPRTKPAHVAYLANDIMQEYAFDYKRTGELWPDLALRAHYHQHYDSRNAHPVRVVQMPAWQIKTSHAHKVATESLADLGGLIITLDEGRIQDIEAVTVRPSRGDIWTP